ncbi:MAG: aminoglycoside phosphotransferase family protein [Pirellulaceae bacterium]|nr:aminoglycoside phosphotransferase family protein [Planctomycetales bacterium]
MASLIESSTLSQSGYRDPGLPGLTLVLSPDALRRTMLRRRALRTDQRLRLTYLRYKPGRRCLAFYCCDSPIGTEWFYAVAHRRESWSKHAVRYRRVQHYRPDWNLWTLDGLCVSFYPFPTDPNLRIGRVFGDPNARRDFLQRVFRDRPEWHGGTLSVLAYKPERRCMAKLSVDGQPCAAIKFYAPGDFEPARIRAKQFRSSQQLRIPEIVGRSKRHRVLAMQWLPGNTWYLPSTWDDMSESALEGIGRALATLHRHHAGVELPMRLPDLGSDLSRLADDIARLTPERRNDVSSLFAEMAACWSTNERNSVVSHGDFYGRQVLPDSGHVGIIDFDQSRWDDFHVDLGNFLAHASYDSLRTRDNAFSEQPPVRGNSSPTDELCHSRELIFDRIADSLCHGYEVASGRQVDHNRLKIATAIGLARLLPQPFRRNEPQWQSMMAHMLQEIRQRVTSACQPHAYAAASINLQSPGFLANTPNTPDNSTAVVRDSQIPWLEEMLDLSKVRRRWTTGVEGGSCASWRAPDAAALLRHKPGRRCLIEYRWLDNGRPEPKKPVLLGKVRARGLDLRTYNLQRELSDRYGHRLAAAGMTLPKPFGLVPTWNMWLQEKMPGISPWDLLDNDWSPILATRIAMAVAALHCLPIDCGREHRASHELDILLSRLLPMAARSEHKHKIVHILQRCEAIVDAIPDVPPQLIHRDFYPDQVLVDGPNIVFLDFDLAAMGDGQLDIGNFIAHLIEWNLRRGKPANASQSFSDALVNAYCMIMPAATARVIHAYVVLSLARHIELSTRLPGRGHTTVPLIHLVTAKLDSVT